MGWEQNLQKHLKNVNNILSLQKNITKEKALLNQNRQNYISNLSPSFNVQSMIKNRNNNTRKAMKPMHIRRGRSRRQRRL
jgi:hypothetical protein